MSHAAVTWVLEHSKSVGTDKVLMLSIAHHMNSKTGTAWPAMETLALHAGVHERSAQRALRRLEEAGELTVSLRSGGSRDGRYRTNVYAFPRMVAEASNPSTEVASMPPLDENREVALAPPLNQAEVASMPPLEGSRGGVWVPAEVASMPPEQEENKENTSRAMPSVQDDPVNLLDARRERLEREFEEFWSAYPRHDARKNAFKAWAKLTQSKRDAAMDAVDRYARQVRRNRTEKRFIPYGATWLNGERWDDVPKSIASGPRTGTEHLPW